MTLVTRHPDTVPARTLDTCYDPDRYAKLLEDRSLLDMRLDKGGHRKTQGSALQVGE